MFISCTSVAALAFAGAALAGSNPACPNPAQDCLVGGGAPGCSDEACCNLVCDLDPFCCNTVWDGLCASGALANCAFSPVCNECCPADLNSDGVVDGADLGILLAAWGTKDPCTDLSGDGTVDGADLGLMLAAWGPCSSGIPCACAAADHDCFTTGDPGCTDVECCELVCATDPFCCQVAWDGLCVAAANVLCAPPNCPGTGDCFQDHGTPGCSDTACCTEVCGPLGYLSCCTTDWDQTCADVACDKCTQPVNVAFCALATPEGEACGKDDNGGCNLFLANSSCCSASEDAGCSEPLCEATICAVDPFCCEVAWDGLCAEQALLFCASLCAPSVNFGSISDGETICGSLWAEDGVRDVDSYQLTLASTSKVTVQLTPGVPCEMGILTPDDCGSLAFRWKPSELGPCPPAGGRHLSVCLPAGSHVIVVASRDYNGVPCGAGADSEAQNTYLLSVEIDECTECIDATHDCFTEGDPGCSDQLCCIEVCFADPFCCEVAWDSLCVSAAFQLCAQLACPLACDPGSTLEGEHCAADTNGGCNGVPPVFGSISCGEVVCGITWADGNFRDTDWFEITLFQQTTIDLGICTEIPMVLGIVDTGGIPDCALASQLNPFIQVPGCLCATFTISLPAGTWWVFAAPQAFTGYPCDAQPHRYLLSVDCL
jgi:hypothetical protein